MSITILECGRTRERCTCGNPATLACEYPVKREGQPATCARRLCKRCSVRMPKVGLCCLAHARVLGAKA